MTRRVELWPLGILSALLLVAPAAAGEFVFNPWISSNVGYHDNVDFVEEGGESDVSLRLGVGLPLEYRTPRTSFTLQYNPSVEYFDEQDQFDNTRHQASVGLVTRPTSISNLRLEADFIETEREIEFRAFDQIDDVELFLFRRAERQGSRLSGAYQWRFTRTWTAQVDAGYQKWEFDQAVDDPEPDPPIGLEDREQFSAGFEAAHTLSATSSIGARYEARRFELETGGDQDAHLLSLVGTRQYSPQTRLRFELGAAYIQDDRVSDTGQRLEDDRFEPQGRLDLTRTYRRSDLTLTLRHRPSAGGARPGTATVSAVGLDYDREVTRRFSWSTEVRYGYRDPTLTDQPDIEAVGATLGAEVRFTRHLSLRSAIDYVQQLEPEDRDVLALRGGLGLIWYPLGTTRLARAGGEDAP